MIKIQDDDFYVLTDLLLFQNIFLQGQFLNLGLDWLR